MLYRRKHDRFFMVAAVWTQQAWLSHRPGGALQLLHSTHQLWLQNNMNILSDEVQ